MQHLRVLLIKDSYRRPEDMVKAPLSLTRCELASGIPGDGCMYVREERTGSPKWLPFVRQGVRDVPDVTDASNAAVLLIHAHERWFAFTLGYGRNLLKAEAWERDFGLKVTLNSVDPSELRSVDAHSFEELSLRTSRQVSRSSGLQAFGLNTSQEILRGVAGVPRDKDFARRVGGSDGLAIAAPITFGELPAKCGELLTAYSSERYKENGFGFVDNLRGVGDPEVIRRLDGCLLSAIEAGDATKLHLAPPEALDWSNVEGLLLGTGSDQEPADALALDDLRAALSSECTTTNRQALGDVKVAVKYDDALVPHERWSAYQCIVFEAELDGALFVLDCGKWYEADRAFVDGLNRRVGELTRDAPALPAAASSDRTEDDYLDRIGQPQGFVVLHRASGSGEAEVCDLVSSDLHLVHVKRYKGSTQSLSHMFTQGQGATRLLLEDAAFRESATAAIRSRDGTLADRFERAVGERSFSVAYGVVYRPVRKRDWPTALPLLAKVTLDNSARFLALLGIRTSLSRIQ